MSLMITVVVISFATIAIYGSVVIIKATWEQSIEIEQFTDAKDGVLGKFISESLNFNIRNAQGIHRDADAQAISIGNTLSIPFLKDESRALQEIENLDIKIKEVPLNIFIKLLRTIQKPAYSIRGRVLSSQSTLSVDVESIDGSRRPSSILVSISRTGHDDADAEKLATETTYKVLYELQNRFKGKETMTPSNWQSLEFYTQALKDLQDYRFVTRHSPQSDMRKPQEYLDSAIGKLKQVVSGDSNYIAALYYLGVAYFESRGKEDEAIKCFEEVLSRKPEPPFSLEARFYLGYSYFRKYTEEGYEKASKEYEPLRDALLVRLQSHLPNDERVKTQGLLAETYCQLANVFAHRIASLRPVKPNPAEILALRPNANRYQNDAIQYSREAEDIVQTHLKDLSPDIVDDIEWRRHNALGVAEFRYAYFDESTKYDEHFDQAVKELQIALLKSPGNFNVLENIGRVLRDPTYSKRDLNKAEGYFLRAADLKPADWYAPQELGTIYEQQWNNSSGEEKERYFKRMIDAYEKAATLGSKFAKSHLGEIQQKKSEIHP